MTDAEQSELRHHRQQAVLDAMSAISEECWCAGWLDGLERSLWLICFEGADREFGMGTVYEQTVTSLRQAAELCDTWWHWPEEAHSELPITLAEAKRLYGSR